MNRKEPSQAELDEMWDFGQYVSWMLEQEKNENASLTESDISESDNDLDWMSHDEYLKRKEKSK